MVVNAYDSDGTCRIMLKCPVSADSSIFCFSEPSLGSVTLPCLSGPGTAPDLRDIVVQEENDSFWSRTMGRRNSSEGSEGQDKVEGKCGIFCGL